MEDWQLDFEWLRVRHIVKDTLKKDSLPDLNLVLLMIGIQELGFWKKNFTKEEKQDLMHIAVCHLLSYDGYYEFVGRDVDGWPHYRPIHTIEAKGEKAQERLLKINAVRYFQELNNEDNTLS
jgi:hypothetical protein